MQFGYAKGLQVRIPSGNPDKRDLIDTRRINGPIQLDLYRRRKSDSLQPLILPSIRVVGFDSERVDTYVNAKKVGEEIVPQNQTMVVGAYPRGQSIRHVQYRKPYDTQSTPGIKMSSNSTPILHQQAGFALPIDGKIEALTEDQHENLSFQEIPTYPTARDIGYRSLASAYDNKTLSGINGPEMTDQ